MLKQARSCAGELRTHAMVYITMTDYCNLGKTTALESGLKTLWGETHINPLGARCYAEATACDATRVMCVCSKRRPPRHARGVRRSCRHITLYKMLFASNICYISTLHVGNRFVSPS